MSTLIIQPPPTYTARCSSCGLEITTRRHTGLPRQACPRCLPGRLEPQDDDLLPMTRQPREQVIGAVMPANAR